MAATIYLARPILFPRTHSVCEFMLFASAAPVLPLTAGKTAPACPVLPYAGEHCWIDRMPPGFPSPRLDYDGRRSPPPPGPSPLARPVPPCAPGSKYCQRRLCPRGSGGLCRGPHPLPLLWSRYISLRHSHLGVGPHAINASQGPCLCQSLRCRPVPCLHNHQSRPSSQSHRRSLQLPQPVKRRRLGAAALAWAGFQAGYFHDWLTDPTYGRRNKATAIFLGAVSLGTAAFEHILHCAAMATIPPPFQLLLSLPARCRHLSPLRSIILAKTSGTT